MTENITIIDPSDGFEYNLILPSEDAERAQNDVAFAEELLETAKKHISTEIHIPGDYNPMMRWNSEAVTIMLDGFKDGGGKMDWNNISAKISALGVYVSNDQCKGKMKAMKRTYQSLKATNGVWGNGKMWPYYEAMDEIYGDTDPAKYTLGESSNTNEELVYNDVPVVQETWELVEGDVDEDGEDVKPNPDEDQPAPKRQKANKTCKLDCHLCNEKIEMLQRHRSEKKQFQRELLQVLKAFPSGKKKGKPEAFTYANAVKLLDPIVDMSSSDESDCCENV